MALSDDDYRHPTADRTTRLEQALALLREGSNASTAERTWARRIVDDHGARLAAERQRVETDDEFAARVNDTLARMADLMSRTAGDTRWPGPAESRSQQRARDVLDDLEGTHEAEMHAGKLGMLIVWRADRHAAERLANWPNARIRVPDGADQIARKSSGTIEDPETGRCGVLYSRRDLRPAR